MARYDSETGVYLGEPEPVSTPEPTPEPTYDTVDPRRQSQQLYDHLVNVVGTSRSDAAAEAFNFLAQSAIGGDKRAVVNDPGYQPLAWSSDPRRAVGADRPTETKPT